jgi:hypothetical protein
MGSVESFILPFCTTHVSRNTFPDLWSDSTTDEIASLVCILAFSVLRSRNSHRGVEVNLHRYSLVPARVAIDHSRTCCWQPCTFLDCVPATTVARRCSCSFCSRVRILFRLTTLLSSNRFALLLRPPSAEVIKMSRDPQYNDIRQRMVGAVHEYHQHTGLIKRFITSHGQDINGWETWDVAPFHVLNARKGVPVPKEILHALDAAITGRSAVSDEFTEANTNPNIFMDASDISHRVFVEKLRTARRIWFPTVPENFSVTPSTSSGGSQNKGLRLIQTSTDEKEPTKVGIFSALAGSATGPEFYKVSFGSSPES